MVADNIVCHTLALLFSDGIPQSYLLQVKGTSSLSCKAVQETFSASSLNTNDCFVLVDTGLAYVWYGKVRSEENLPAGRVSINTIVAGLHW